MPMEAILLEEVECVAGAVGTRVVQEAKDGVAFLKTGAVVVLFLVAEEGVRTQEAADNPRPHSPWIMAALSTLLEATPRSQCPSSPEALLSVHQASTVEPQTQSRCHICKSAPTNSLLNR